jgi:alkylation response protein AidB-like acyl-CoA dehydrogenase
MTTAAPTVLLNQIEVRLVEEPRRDRSQVKARTETGARLVRLAEELGPTMAECAGEHDREGTYPFEAIEALKAAGYFVAPFDESLGGLGVTSVHDLALASSRLAHFDPSVAIGVNMHLSVTGNMARRWRMAKASGNERRLGVMTAMIREVVDEGLVIATASSEANQHLTRPNTTAVRTDDGWLVNGHKIFATMSPAADLFYVAVRFEDGDGQEMYGWARVPARAPGVVINYDWDALGMRASGSHSLTLTDVSIPDLALPGGFSTGVLTPGYIEGNLTAGLYHAAACMGIAEAAHTLVAGSLIHKRERGATLRASEATGLAENAIELSAMRASVSRAGTMIDDCYEEYPASDVPFEEALTLFAEVQATKAFITDIAPRVVDRALALSGGAGFMNTHPLSRAYRDVRAGAFMHPLGANRALEFISQVALGVVPDLS